MLDLDKLEEARILAESDKADLFDFYHDNWDRLVAEVRDYHHLLDHIKQSRLEKLE